MPWHISCNEPEEIEILEAKKVTCIEFTHTLNITGTIIGVDPGTANMGIAILYDSLLSKSILFEIKMQRLDTMMERVCKTLEVCKTITYNYDLFTLTGIQRFVIEGAAYGKQFRQVELAEQRAAIGIWAFTNCGVMADVVAPQSVRKVVFGSAKIRAKEVWKLSNLPHNASAALSVALWGYMQNTHVPQY